MPFDLSLIDGPFCVPATFTDDKDDRGRPVRIATSWRPELHINIAAELMTEDLKAYAVVPVTPERVFATLPGEDPAANTAFLVFRDLDEVKAVLPEALLDRIWAPLKDSKGQEIADRKPDPAGTVFAASRIDAEGGRSGDLLTKQPESDGVVADVQLVDRRPAGKG